MQQSVHRLDLGPRLAPTQVIAWAVNIERYDPRASRHGQFYVHKMAADRNVRHRRRRTPCPIGIERELPYESLNQDWYISWMATTEPV